MAQQPMVGADGKYVSYDGGNSWVPNTAGLQRTTPVQQPQPVVSEPYRPPQPTGQNINLSQYGISNPNYVSPSQMSSLQADYENIEPIRGSGQGGTIGFTGYTGTQIPKLSVISATGERQTARVDDKTGTQYQPFSQLSGQGYVPEKAPGVAYNNTQVSGAGFVDLSNQPNLRLTSGQVISNKDPNYSQYANIPGVTKVPVQGSTVNQASVPPARPPQVTSTQGNIQTFADGSQLDTSTGQPIRPANPAQGNPSGETPQQTMDRIRQQQGATRLPSGQYISPNVQAPDGRPLNEAPYRPPASLTSATPTPTPTGTVTGALPPSGEYASDAYGTSFGGNSGSRETQLRAILDEILKGQQSTPEEQSTQSALDALIAQQANLAASRDLGVADIRNQAIAMPFISGQQTAVERSAAAKMGALEAQGVPLKTKLAAQQAKRAAATEAAKTRLGFETDREKMSLEREKIAYDRSKNATEANRKIEEEKRKIAKDSVESVNKIRDDARAALKLSYDTYGSDAIKKLSPEERRKWEERAELPQGTLDYAGETIKEEEVGIKKRSADEGRYKTIAATKWHPTLTLDTLTGKYVDGKGNQVSSVIVAKGRTNPTTTTTSTSKPKGFDVEVGKAVSRLKAGEDWGVVWNSMKARFPSVSNNVLDASLGKDSWSKPGAYQDFKAKENAAKPQKAKTVTRETDKYIFYSDGSFKAK